MGSNGGYDFRPQDHPFGKKKIFGCDRCQTCSTAELFISYKSVMDTLEVLLFAFLLERIGDVVLAVPWHLPVMVPVGSPFLDIMVVGNRKEVKSVLEVSLDSLLVPSRKKCPHVQ